MLINKVFWMWKRFKWYETVDEYIAIFPEDKQIIIKKVREFINNLVPNANEKIAWDMPSLYLNGKMFFSYAMFKNHFSIFPWVEAIEHFKEKLAKYKTSKWTIQFQLTEELPFSLIRDILKYCENLNNIKHKK